MIQIPLLPTDPSQDKILEEFLDRQKSKAALEHLDKRLKKARKEHGVRLQLMRTLLCIQRDRAQNLNEDASVYMPGHIASLAAIAPELARDYVCLEAVDDFGKGNWSSQFWARACDIHTHDEQVPDAWFEIAFRRHQYDDAAKACFLWRRNFPQRYQDLTWRMILCHHLASKGSEVKEKQQKLSLQMCKRLVEQAVSNTPLRDAKAPTIRNQLDLELVCSVKLAHDQRDATLDILDSEHCGLRSPMSNWNLALTKARLLADLGRKDELRAFSREIIQDALIQLNGTEKQRWGYGESGDDRVFIGHLVNLVGRDSYDETRGLLDSLAATGSHNAEWGLVLFHCRHSGKEIALRALEHFWRLYAPRGKALDFDVIREVPQHLQVEFVAFSSKFCSEKCEELRSLPLDSSAQRTAATVASIAQSLDLQSRFFAETAAVDKIESIIVNCISLWQATYVFEPKKAAADNGIGDEVLILAARLCLFLHHTNRSRYRESIFHARFLLELLVSHSRHNFRALILLVRICLCQGAAITAMSYYRRLDIKNLQFVTESTLMFRDISFLLPKSLLINRGGVSDVLAGMHRWVRDRIASYDNYVLEALTEGNWAGALDQVEMKRETFASQNAAMISLQICRIADCGMSSMDADTVASAKHFLVERAAKGRLVEPDSTALIRDSMAKEFVFEQSLVDLSEHTEHGFADTNFWTTIIMNDVRDILRGAPPTIAHTSADTVCAEFAMRAYSVVRALVEVPATESIEALFDSLSVCIDERTGQFENPTKLNGSGGDDECHNNAPLLGQSIVRICSTIDAFRFLDEVMVWVITNRPKQAPRAKALLVKIQAILGNLAAWTDTFASPDEDAINALVASVSRGQIGEKIASLLGHERLRELTTQHLGSIHVCLDGIKSVRK